MARVAPTSTGNPNEVHSGDVPIRPYQVLDMTSPQAVRSTDIITSVDDDVLQGTYADQLAFNEERLDIRIEPGRERNAAKAVDVSVNGDRRFLPVGVPITIQRKFVEVLARAQPFGVTTEHEDAHHENPRNITHRNPYRAVAFSVLHDPSPRGHAWLNKISYEG
jgi:hypothetical protein